MSDQLRLSLPHILSSQSFELADSSDVNPATASLHFVKNMGQVDTRAEFYAHTSAYTLWLTPESLVFDTMHRVDVSVDKVMDKKNSMIRRDVSRLQFVGANTNPALQPVDESAFKVNVLKGSDKSKWQHNVSTFQAIIYRSLYKGIDLKVYGMAEQVEYDWIVNPGANPLALRFTYSGVDHIEIDDQGNLLVTTGVGTLIHKRPVTYQQIENKTIEVPAEYQRLGNNTYGFQIGEYDKRYALIIDPVVLAYSTFLGGNNNDEGRSIAVDNQGNVYVTGITYSTDFPVLDQYMLDPDDMDGDVFITRIDTTKSGSAGLVYSTYLGGSGKDTGTGITLGESGNVYVIGETLSSDFPVLNQYQSDLGDNKSDAFVCKLDTTQKGSAALVYSTYLGGSGKDTGTGIALDRSGNVYVTGETWSSDFPVVNEQMTDPGDSNSDVFISKLDMEKSGSASLLYSTYLGGNSSDSGKGIAVDNSGFIYVTGATRSPDFPTVKQYMADPGDGGSDVFVSKVDTAISGTAGLLFSTYLGGDSVDSGTGIAVDSQGNVYVTGETWSSDFPVLNEYMADPGDGWGNAFVSKIETKIGGNTSLLFSTYLGGDDYDIGWSIAVDRQGYAYVTGETWSQDFPFRDQLFVCRTGFNTDAFITKINTNNTGDAALQFSTCFGGSDDDFGNSIAVDNHGSIYLTGATQSTDFPLYNQYQDSGGYHSFVARINIPIFPWALFLPAMLGVK